MFACRSLLGARLAPRRSLAGVYEVLPYDACRLGWPLACEKKGLLGPAKLELGGVVCPIWAKARQRVIGRGPRGPLAHVSTVGLGDLSNLHVPCSLWRTDVLLRISQWTGTGFLRRSPCTWDGYKAQGVQQAWLTDPPAPAAPKNGKCVVCSCRG